MTEHRYNLGEINTLLNEFNNAFVLEKIITSFNRQGNQILITFIEISNGNIVSLSMSMKKFFREMKVYV